MELAEARIDVQRYPKPVGHDRGGLPSAGQVARIDGGDPVAGDLRCECTRLFAAALVERRIRLSLPPSVAVPVRLAVAGEEQCRHPV